MSKPPTEFAAVVTEVSTLVATLREALRDALEGVLPESSGGRACGRVLGLKRDLGWKIYAIATSTDAPTVLRLLPRRAGWQLVLKGLGAARCPDGKIRALAAAIEAITERLDAAHIDRDLLRSVAAGGLDTGRESLAMVRCRTAARRANEEIYGVRAEALLGASLVGPPDPDHRVAILGFTQFEGLRRLRPGHAVPVHYTRQARTSGWSGVRADLGAGVGRRVPGLVADLSDPAIDAGLVRAVERPPGTVIEYLGDGSEPPRGHRVVFADVLPHEGTVGRADAPAQVDLLVDLPIAYALCEVWLHREIRRTGDPAAALLGSFGRGPVLGDDIDLVRLPLEATVEAITKPSLPRPFASGRHAHLETLRRGAARLGRPLDEFEGFRVVVRDPPVGSRVTLAWRM